MGIKLNELMSVKHLHASLTTQVCNTKKKNHNPINNYLCRISA